MLFIACDDDKEVLIDNVNDITLNDLELDRFTHSITNGGFKSGIINFNTVKNQDGSFSGFALSNRNNRSFTWSDSQEALDSNIYSVYTAKPNYTKNYALAKVKDEDAFFTLDTPKTIQHILVANTTYTYLALKYGDVFGTIEKNEINPNLESKPKGIWYTYVDGGVKKMSKEDKDYFKLIITGYLNNSKTGEVEFYLCNRGADSNNPTHDYVINDWYRVDLVSLGNVDKVEFKMESTDIDANTNKMRTPSYFCLDGIRLQ